MLRYPTDHEGYAQPSADLVADVQKYGFGVLVVLTDPQELKASQEALLTHFGCTRDPKTWETHTFPHPKSPFLSKHFADDPCAWQNRQHPKIVQAFTQLFGTAKLVCNVDYYCFRRGTMPDRADWRTRPLRLHWDLCDISELKNDFRHTRFQGILALNDNSREVGSFAAVPGVHNDAHKVQVDRNKYVPKQHEWQQHIQKLPLRAGHMIIWDVRTPHANFENHSTLPRMAQFIRWLPPSQAHRDKQCITRLPKYQSHISFPK